MSAKKNKRAASVGGLVILRRDRFGQHALERLDRRNEVLRALGIGDSDSTGWRESRLLRGVGLQTASRSVADRGAGGIFAAVSRRR
jgi:hypothetical protein